MELNLLDYTFALMDSTERALEFGIVIHLKTRVSHALVEAGANKALKLYPKAACCIRGTKWVPIAGKFTVKEITVIDDQAKKELIDQLLSQKMNIHEERLIRQYLIHHGNKTSILTHVHHALADGASTAFWLQAQFGNYTSPANGEISYKEATVKEKLSRYRFDSVSDYIRPENSQNISGNKRTSSWFFEPLKVEEQDYTYNDLLVAAILKSIKQWDQSIKKASVWMPVSIRQSAYVGFGNGSSRVRIYDHTKTEDSLAELAKSVREQVIWNRKNGTWHVPTQTWLVKLLNLWPIRSLFKKYLSRNSLDYSTTIFSHMEFLQSDQELYHIMEDVEVVNLLHHKIPVSLFAIGFGNKTNLTITYDEALFGKARIEEFKKILQKNILQA